MAIKSTKNMPISSLNLSKIYGYNYYCDICNEPFKYKHDAKLHALKHGTDKSYLDSMSKHWYRVFTTKEIYMYIDTIDYAKNTCSVMYLIVNRSNNNYALSNNLLCVSLTKHIKTIDRLKRDLFEARRVSRLDVFCKADECTDYILDEISCTEDDINGN